MADKYVRRIIQTAQPEHIDLSGTSCPHQQFCSALRGYVLEIVAAKIAASQAAEDAVWQPLIRSSNTTGGEKS